MSYKHTLLFLMGHGSWEAQRPLVVFSVYSSHPGWSKPLDQQAGFQVIAQRRPKKTTCNFSSAIFLFRMTDSLLYSVLHRGEIDLDNAQNTTS